MLGVFPDNSLDWPAKRVSCVAHYRRLLSDFGVTDWDSRYIPPNSHRESFDVSDSALVSSIYSSSSAHRDITSSFRLAICRLARWRVSRVPSRHTCSASSAPVRLCADERPCISTRIQ
jgi:hypothetical protein